jgi:aerobic-type carbon monoxide dehydrogenase small subunit (CoxS/CutS family)
LFALAFRFDGLNNCLVEARAMQQARFTMTVNGKAVEATTDPARPLLEILREDLGLTGVKYGCGEGACGACVVLMDGRRTPTCNLPVSRAQGKAITTIEGLADGDRLHPVQQAFLDENAFQCGYCTPGMILTAAALLAENGAPTDQEIVDAMNGNVCRCCGYVTTLAAVKRAAQLMDSR